jgi:hypothetical protein
MHATIRTRTWTTLVAIAALGTGGCTATLGHVALVTPEDAAPATKLLRPGAEGRSCRSWVLGIPTAGGDPSLDDALAQILALDPEGNAVANVEVRSERTVTGIYNRRCVVVRGDLVRTIATMTLPIPGGHHHPH